MKTFASVISVLLFASAAVAAPTTADQIESPNQWAKFEKRNVATSDAVSEPQNWGGLEQKREQAKSEVVINLGGFVQKREEAKVKESLQRAPPFTKCLRWTMSTFSGKMVRNHQTSFRFGDWKVRGFVREQSGEVYKYETRDSIQSGSPRVDRVKLFF
ncbi:uncharacterized protein LACBIDRAFT_314099 [Laccaria bicolor S238N-H82]|uniref:Predicted protein n=1 Tax=Laccaria bicolor (strain S238N-H82 / ATCC MYA-4686) TaxID=486041 RepID=B0D1K9_LACBS|nr:uncharacterized protein LACBIDRAFT_314099 [Laccaria bicolor S238N-H82]EDR12012.1 predicted protein [Laccaria bicolor S238N-H82]|eukprot:XP_001877909.1 predicted protein [Laccaria bicolor S238N-H82]